MTTDLTPQGGHRRVLALVAHPDDETFGLGSLLLRSAAAGATTAVCCATRGEAGSPREGFPPAGPELGRCREAELRAAAALLGVDRTEVLGYADSGMAGDPRPGTLAAAPTEEVTSRFAEVARAFGPDALLTVDGGDGHRDHLAVRAAAERLADALAVPLYLSCLSRDLMRRWAAHMQEQDPDNVYLHLGELGTPPDELDLVLDSADQVAARETAVRAHASQHSPFEGLPEDLRRAFLTREFLQVRLPATTT